MIETLIFVGFAFLFLFNLFGFYFVSYITNFTLKVTYKITFLLLSFLNTVVLTAAGASKLSGPLTFFAFFAILVIEFSLIFRTDFFVVLSSASVFVFHILCARAIAASLISMTFDVGIYVIQRDVIFRVSSLFIAIIIIFIIFWIYIKKWPREALIALYGNKRQVKMLCTVEIIMMVYQLLCAFSYNLVTSEFWFTVFHLSSACLGVFWHYILTANSVKYSVWLSQSFKTDILNEQINRQLTHYEAYEKQFEGFRQFRAEYDRLIGDVRHNINKGDIQAAQAILFKAGENVKKLESERQRYCSNMLVDSILWDTACSAQAKGIEFSAQIALPDWLRLSEIEYCRIFANLCTNAVEAAEKAPKPSFIRFSSAISGPWLTIVQENSYCEIVKHASGKLVTTKQDAELHGVGINSIREILEKHGGFGEILIDEKNKIFKFIIHLNKSGQ